MAKFWVPQESDVITVNHETSVVVSGVVVDHILEVPDEQVDSVVRFVSGARYLVEEQEAPAGSKTNTVKEGK